MLAWIRFHPDWSGWSAFTFWTVVVTIIVTLAFTLVVLVRGVADLRYLLNALDEDLPAPEGEIVREGAAGEP